MITIHLSDAPTRGRSKPACGRRELGSEQVWTLASIEPLRVRVGGLLEPNE